MVVKVLGCWEGGVKRIVNWVIRLGRWGGKGGCLCFGFRDLFIFFFVGFYSRNSR